MQRWVISDVAGSTSYQMVRNPKTMGSPIRTHRTTTTPVGIDGRRRGVRAPDLPGQWSFAGRLRSKAEYDALLGWANYQARVRITDHLGRLHEVMPLAFEPVPVPRSGEGNPWLFDYTFKALYVRRVP